MPRAIIPPRLLARQVPQLIAAAKRDVDGAVDVIDDRTTTLESGLPAGLQDTIDAYELRLTALETA